MVDNDRTSPTLTASELALLSHLDELRSAWEEYQPQRAEGGLLALSGFDHQFSFDAAENCSSMEKIV